MQDNEKKPALRFKGFTDPWEQRKLTNLCEKFTDGDWIEAKDQSDSGVRLVQTGNVGVTEYLDKPNNKKWISFETFEQLHCEEVYPGDILISRLPEPAGRACIMPNLGTKMITAVDCTIVRPNAVTSTRFLLQYLSSQAYFDAVNTCLAGGTRQRISRGNLAQFNVPIPSSKIEQEKIGEVLEKLDTLITLHQRKYEKLVNIKKSMLDKMFPKNGASVPEIRFKGFTDPWEQRKLGDAFERVVRKNTNNESRLPLTISAQDGLVDQITYFNNRVASRDVSNYYLVYNGEFAYNKSTSDGYPFGAVKRLDWYEKGVLSTLYIVFALKHPEKDDSDFMTVFYDTDRWHRGVAERAAEGARNHGLLNISADDFFDIDTTMPEDKVEQEKIGRLLKKLDTLITLHQRKLEKLQNIKKSCLEKMFV